MNQRIIQLVCLLTVVTNENLPAQTPPPLSKRVTDMVGLKDGPALYGAIVQQTRQRETTMMVSRDWLQKANPKLYAARISQEKQAQAISLKQLDKRLQTWINERASETDSEENKSLLNALKNEQKRLRKQQEKLTQQPDATNDTAQFFEFRIPGKQVRRTYRQPIERRRVAAWAWHEQLPNVETRAARDLKSVLEARGVISSGPMPNLSNRLPAPASESAEDWAIRQALFEYQFRKPLDFHGTQGVLIRVTEGQQPDPAQMMKLLQKQLNSQLGALLEPGGLQQKFGNTNEDVCEAIAAAKQERARGFRVTTTQQDIAKKSARVTTRFYAQLPGDEWKLIYQTSHAENLSDKTTQQQAGELQADASINQILSIAKSFGANQAVVQQALGFGAATRKALHEVDGTFREFLDPYLRRLDRPAVVRVKASGK